MRVGNIKHLGFVVSLLVSTIALVPLGSQSLSDLSDQVYAAQFLEDGFALVNAPEYVDALKTELDAFAGFSVMVDVQSRWVPASFVLRSTNKDGGAMFGDAADGRVDGIAMREKLALMIGLGTPSQVALRAGILLDYVFASHIDTWFEALASDVFTGGGSSGFSAYAFVSGPFVNLRIANLIDVTWLAWLKQRHPYDASGAFLSTWVPDYTGSAENSEGNYLEPWSTADAGRGDYDGDLFWPEDRVKYRREFDNVLSVWVAGFNLNTVLSEQNGLAALRFGIGSLRELFGSSMPEFFALLLRVSGEYLQGQYNFNRSSEGRNLIWSPFLPIGPFGGALGFEALAMDLNLQVWEPAFNSLTLEYHLNSAPAGFSPALKSMINPAAPISGVLGFNLFTWRDGQLYAGFLAKIGLKLPLGGGGAGFMPELDLGLSYNYERELKKAISRRNQVIGELGLSLKLGL